MIVAGYYRRSVDLAGREEEAKSIATQQAEVRRFVESRGGWTLGPEFSDDDIGGAITRRPGLDALIAAAHARQFTAVAVVELGRLYRDVLDLGNLVRDLDAYGVAVWDVDTGQEAKTTTALDAVMLSLRGYAGQDYREKVSSKAHQAAANRQRQGLVVGGRCFGFTNIRTCGGCGAARCPHPARREPDPATAPVVKRIFELIASGLGMARVANLLNAEGVEAPSRYTAATRERLLAEGKRIVVGWCISSIREILNRRLYLGEVQPFSTRRALVFDPVKRERREGRRDKTEKDSETAVRVDQGLQIVTPELWDRAHARIAKARVAFAGRGFIPKADSVKGLYLLSGVLSCGTCGSALHARRRGRNNRLVYVCSARYARGKATCSNTTGIPAVDLHRTVARAMQETFTPDALRAHLDSLSSDEGQAARAKEREALIARLPELAVAQERLAKATTRAIIADDEVLLGTVKEQYAEAKSAAEAAQARLGELEGIERDLREQRQAIEQAGEAMTSWTELLGRAEVEPQHLDAARKFLGAVLVGPIAVKPTDYGWSFEGRSRMDGRLLGFLSGPSDPEPTTVVVRMGGRPTPPPIAGGSDAHSAIAGGSRPHGPDMAPHTPQRSERLGLAVALLDAPWRSSILRRALSS